MKKTINILGTVTGRTSSSVPSDGNIPRSGSPTGRLVQGMPELQAIHSRQSAPSGGMQEEAPPTEFNALEKRVLAHMGFDLELGATLHTKKPLPK
jgi:hypothetical protein